MCGDAGVIASLLAIPLPFSLEFCPSYCKIQGKPLTPPPSQDSKGGFLTMSSHVNEETEIQQYRLSLHMLALNVRHLMLSQLCQGGEQQELEVYTRMCARNDISPLGTLRALTDVCSLACIGRGEPIGTEYAIAQHAKFARAEKEVPNPDPSNTLGTSLAVVGDLECGDAGTDWALVLPPPPSETDD
jgi:hypothetical protein